MHMENMANKRTCGIVLFPGMTQLDATGPYEVLCRVPGVSVMLLALDRHPICTEHGMVMVPDCTFEEAPDLDVLCIPGGPGVNETLLDSRYLNFVQQSGSTAEWVTSVCTGALLLGAAGLLRGYRAT